MSVVSGSSSKVPSKLSIKKDLKINNEDSSKCDFIVGDRVYIASNPERLGTTAFNGTTRFSEGIWIGVVLDEPFGKNNGIVQGVKYFQCEENHGIFVRQTNLRHISVKNLNMPTQEDNKFNNSGIANNSEEHNFTEPFPILFSPNNINLGDRVYVSGKSGSSVHKNGILRFLGNTKFADGIWAGIELDNPIGKNDGSVNGVRYFSCKPLYGLFALADKVKKWDQSIVKNRMESCSKYGSNESVSSIASNFSSASRTRVRLGMNAVSNTQKFKGEIIDKGKPSKTNSKDLRDSENTSSAMQNVLKEKELHVEQLMREREIERIDFATATAKIEELEKHQTRNLNTFNDQKLIYDKKISELQNTVYLVCQERDHLSEKLEEEKKKVDDLLFRMEEKNIDESDLEHKTEENESQIFELNEKLALERELRDQLESKLKIVPLANDGCPNESKYISQIKNLEEKLLTLEFDLAKEKNNSKVISLMKLLEEKDAVVNDLKDRFDEVKCNLSEATKEMDSVKKIQYIHEDENKSLKEEIVNLRSLIESLNEQTSKLKKERTPDRNKKYENSEISTQTEKDTNIEQNVQDMSSMKDSLDRLNKENENIKSTLSAVNDKYKVHVKETELIKMDYNELQQKYNQLEFEKADQIKSKRSVVEENDKLSKQLSSNIEQLEKLRAQVSDLHTDKKKILESKSEIEHNERNLRIEIDQLKGQITFLEKENNVLTQSLDESENDTTRNTCILQMTLKIEDLESIIQDLNSMIKLEKDQNMELITKNATLYAELEHLKQKKDDTENIMYGQLESIKSINQLLESDKVELSEMLDSKNKELLVIRDRLLKTTQEYEILQESFNENSQKCERDKRLLNDKIRKFEKQLDENERKSQFSLSEGSEKRKSDNKDQIPLLKAAKENSEQQISFLNTVIIDREKKFNNLQLENQSLKEKIKDLESGNTMPITKPKKIIPPRLYCDVCEIFDSHDTEKCSAVISDSTPSSPQLIIRKVNAKAPRIYCDICEIFDSHETSDCQDQLTF